MTPRRLLRNFANTDQETEIGTTKQPERIGGNQNIQNFSIVLKHFPGKVNQPWVSLVPLEGREPHQPVKSENFLNTVFY
jgi:hypothetical protein